MRRIKDFLIAARDNALILAAIAFCLGFCVVLVVGFVISILGAVVGAAVIAGWDKLSGRGRSPRP